VNLPDPKTITRTPFMAGNWKTNPTTLQQVHSLTAMLATMARNTARDKPDLDVEVAVFPPSVFLPVVKSMLADTKIQVRTLGYTGNPSSKSRPKSEIRTCNLGVSE
jgi:triosephosphate isomerase